jgi:hypothetical protein
MLAISSTAFGYFGPPKEVKIFISAMDTLEQECSLDEKFNGEKFRKRCEDKADKKALSFFKKKKFIKFCLLDLAISNRDIFKKSCQAKIDHADKKRNEAKKHFKD